MDNISQNDNIEKLDRELAQIQKSTRTVFSFLVPLHDRLRMTFGWYYKWHLNPVYNFVNLALVVLVTGAMAGLIGLNIFGQTKLISHASSKQIWGSTGSWEGWTLEGTEVDLSTNSITLKTAVTEGAEADLAAKYSANGTAQISYTAYNNETVDWLSAESDLAANGQTLSTQYSTDKVLWTDDIGALADSAEISIRFSLATTDTSVSPKINYLALNYSRLPNPPSGLSFEDKKIPLNHQQILHAGIFSDPDNDLQKASQWQISDKPGDFGNPIVDSGAREKGDFSAYKLDNNLNDGKYSFRVRYQDATGAWGLWSEASFFELKNQTLAVSVAPGGEIPAEASEIQSKRTETTKTSFNPDGTFTLTSYTGLIHYKDNYQDPASQWKDINSSHSIDNPEYVLFDQMPSTVKVFKDKIGYEIESRKTGDKYTVELQDVDGNPKLSTTNPNNVSGITYNGSNDSPNTLYGIRNTNRLISWADINPPQSTNHQPQTTNLAEWLLPSALADEPAVTQDDGNLKFEFQISESGVRLWKTITGPDAPKNFTWNITKTDGAKDATADDLKFRENPEAFEINSSTPTSLNTPNTPAPVTIQTQKSVVSSPSSVDSATDHQPPTTNFLWTETAPQTDLKIDTDVTYNPNADADAGATTFDGSIQLLGNSATWTDVSNGTTASYTSDVAQQEWFVQVCYRATPLVVVGRSIFLFDTHLIGAGATINSATFSVYGSAKNDVAGSAYDSNIYGATTTSNTAITNTDYDNWSATPLSTAKAYADFSIVGYNDYALNTDGKAAIDKAGITKFMALNANYDVADTRPADSGASTCASARTDIYYADYTGTDHDPKLAITYTPAAPSTIDISGTAYTTEAKGANVVADGTTIGLSINGGPKVTTTTTTGVFTFADQTVAANNTIALFIDDNGSYEGTLVSQVVDATTDITGLEMYTNKVVLRHETAGPMTNALLKTADNADDDIHYTNPSGDAITFDAGYELWIDAVGGTKTYTPGAAVTVEDIDINGTFVPSSNAVTVSGSWDSTDGTFTNTSSTVTFTSTTTETITSHAEIFNNLTFNGAAGTWTAQDALVTAASSTLTITNGTLDIANQNFTIGAGGTFTNNATLRLVGGTQTLTNLTIPTTAGTVEYSGTGTYTGLKAANSYYNLKINGSGGTYTLDATTDINGGITLAAGTLAADTQNMTVYGNWTVTSGLFNPGSGTVTFNGGETGGTITSNSQSFNNLTVAGIFPTFADDFSSGINQNHWVDAVPASPVVAESGMITAYETTGALYAFSGLSSLGKWLLQGDFDIQVDFDTSALPAGAEASLLGQYDGGYYSISNYGSGYNSDNMIGNDSTPGATGKLRLVRTGTNLYGYFWGGSSWTQFATASGVSTADYRVIFRTQNLLGGINALAYFDNFQVNSGTLSGTSYASWTMSDALSVANNLTISTGILTAGNNNATIGNYIQSGGTFSAPTPTGGKKLTVNGGWNHSSGTFTHNDGNVTFAGDALIQGSTTFYDFTHATPNKTITVTAETTQTIAGALSINGTDASNKITLVSSSPGTRWNIDPQGTKPVTWVTVSDSTSTTAIDATNSTEGIADSTTNWLSAVVTHTITSSVTGGNGTISPTPTVEVADAGNQDFIITPSEGYYISNIIVDGTPVQTALSSPYTFTNVTTTHTIDVSFTANATCVWDGQGADDNWNTDANWTGNSKPTSACDVIFNNTSDDNSTIDAVFANHIKSLSVNSGYDGTITMAKDLNDDGDFTLNSGAYTAGIYTINVGGSWTTAASPAATFNANTSTVVFNATSSKNITSNSQSFNNITFNGAGGTWTAQDALTAAGTLTLTTGTFDANGQSISIATLAATGSSTRTLDLGEGTWTVSGNWDSSGTNQTVQPRTSTVNFTDTSNITTAANQSSPYDFYNLTAAHGTKTSTLQSSVIVSNLLSVYSGGTLSSTGTIYLKKSDGDPIINTGANINVAVSYESSNSISIAGNTFNKQVWFLGSAADVTYTLTSDLNVAGSIYVYSMIGNMTTLDTVSSNITTTGTVGHLYIGNAAGQGAVDFGTGTHSISKNIKRYNVSTGTIDFASSTVSVGGDIDFTGITVTPGTSTVTMNATTAGKTITSAAQSFNNLTFNGVGGTWTAQDALAAAGTLTLTTGTFDANDQSIGCQDMTATGTAIRTLTLGNGTWTVTRNWDSSGSHQTITPENSTVSLTGTGNLRTQAITIAPYDFYNLQAAANTKTTTVLTDVSVNNDLTLSNGGTFFLNGYLSVRLYKSTGDPLTLNGATVTNGATEGTIIYRPSASISVAGGTFNSYLWYSGVTNNVTITLTSPVSAEKMAIFGFTSAKVATLDTGSQQISADDLYIGHYDPNQTYSGTLLANNSTINVSGGLTIQSAGSGNSNTLNAMSSTINVGGNWTKTSGTFTPGTSTVNLTGAGGTTQTISGDTTFNNFTAIASSARTLQFTGGSTTTVSGAWMVYGASGQLLTLKSTNSSDWTINPATIASPLTYHYLSVDHSINSGTPFCATYSSGTNTTGWYFSTGSSCAGAIQFSASSASGSESTTSVNIGISLPAAQPLDAYVLYAVTGGTATGGGVDYTLASGTAFIPAGSTSTTVPLSIIDDNIDEPNETIIVTLSNPTNAILGANTTYTYTIVDNDNPPTVQFNDSSGSGLESVLAPTIRVALSQQSAYDATVNYAVTGGTATGGGVDYILNAGTLTIPAGQTYADIPITIINDALDELNESVIITLSSPVNASLGDRKIYTYTIKDDDALPQVFFTSPTSSGSESNTAVGLEISLSAVSGRDVTVNYAVVGGTATQGVDYTMPFTSVVIPTGSINAVIPLTIVDDTLVEPNETIIVQLSSAVGASIVSAKNAHTYTIIDNDTTPSYIIQASAVGNGIIDPAGAITVAEGESQRFDFRPNIGYEIASVFKDGENIDTPTSYTFIDVRENHTIVVSFRIRTFTITARSTDSGSAVTPASQVVQYGQNASISINVNAGYHLVSITDNGAIIPVYSQNIYDLSFVTENRLVLFSTAFDYYTLTINKSGNGSGVFSEQMQTVTKFSSINVTATPDDSSIFSGWTGDIISADPNITLGNFTSDVTITGEFTLKKLKIEVIRSQNGTIVPGGVVYVNYSETRKFDMAPNPGYFTSAVIVDGEPLGPLQSYTFVNISSNHTIKADFSVFQYRIQAIAIGNGSVLPAEQTVDFGGDARIASSPESGSVIEKIVDNGVVVPTLSEYPLLDVHANHIVEVYFGQDVVPPSDSELTITAPLPLFSEQLYANINIAWKYEGSNVGKVSRYRISYQTNTADFVILDTVDKDIYEYLWNVDDHVCPFIAGPGAIRVEALDSDNNSLDAAIVEGSYSIPKLSVEIDPADSLSGLYEMDGGSSYQFKATTIADGLATDKKVAWQSDEEAGRFEKEGLFRARYVSGVFDNAISATVDSCGQRSMAQASLKIYAVSEPTPTETVSSTALSAGTAAAVGVTVAASAIANTASLLSLSELWNYLLMPFLLFGSRRRRQNRWGRVLEEGSGLAIPMAKIALLKVEDFSKRPVATSFSDKDGYYGFVAGSGRYVIEVTKDMYHMTEIPGYYTPGREIVVTDEKQGLIVPTIIMAMTEESLKKKLNFFRNLGVYERAAIVVTWIVLLVSSIISVNNLIKYPDNPYVIGIAALNIFLWAININSLFKKSPWGKVLDRNNLAPLSLSLIRVMDPTGTRLVRTAITNEEGKFSTILPKGQYKILVAKSGYNQKEPVTLRTDDPLNLVNKKILIDKNV